MKSVNAKASAPLGHMPQLDSLRALAFFGVAGSHWLQGRSTVAAIGGTGVQLFFVLSGFLITGILLDYRRTQESNIELSAGSALRTFYARRFFRIFPLYYGVIAIAAILKIGPIRELWPWHVAYASNFLYAIHQPSAGDPFRHFWSLGVEEQFYLVWPFLVFFVRLETLKRWIAGLVVCAPIFRLGMEHAFPELHRVNYFPLACGDSLGVGASLAWAVRYETWCGGAAAAGLARGLGIGGMIGGMAVAALMLVLGNAFWLATFGHTFLVCVFGWLVYGAARGFGGWAGRFLNRPELRFLGKISYGLYIFHHFFTSVDMGRLFARVGLEARWADHVVVELLSRFLLTLLAAVTSWYLYEKPLNGLKRYFTLGRKLAAAGKEAV